MLETTEAEPLKTGDHFTLSGFPVVRRKWWQLWKPRVIDMNGDYVVRETIRASSPPS